MELDTVGEHNCENGDPRYGSIAERGSATSIHRSLLVTSADRRHLRSLDVPALTITRTFTRFGGR